MSTKTTFKRIALVTVAAMGFGVMSVAPSQAANEYLECVVADGGTPTAGDACQGVAGVANYVTLATISNAKAALVTVSGASATLSNATTSNGTSATTATVVATGGASATVAASTSGDRVRVNTPAVGTITVSVYPATAVGVYSATAAETVVITVVTTASSGIYSVAKSSVYITSGETFTATADPTTAITAAKTVVADTATASIVVKYLDGLGKPVGGDTLTATITSGPGTITTKRNEYTTGYAYDSSTAISGVGGNVGNAAALSGVNNQYSIGTPVETRTGVAVFHVFANNQAGVTVVTIKNTAGDIVGTKSLTFTDTTIATIEATVLKPTINGDTAGHTYDAIKLVFKDSAGAVIKAPSAYPTVVSGTPTIGGASQAGNGTTIGNDTSTATAGFVNWGVDAVGAKYGDVTYTFTAGLVKATATVKFVSKVATTLDIAASTATAGDKITYTITAKDSTGANIPEGSLLSDYVKSVATTGGIATEVDVTTANKSVAGKWTVTGVAPLISTTLTSTFTLTGTAATLDTNLVAALAATTKVVSVDVSNPGIDAAAAAAEEATAAANDATDAALSAAEAAEAATAMAQEAVDAVAELSAQVTTLISALRKQITTLTNLVVKIQKKVKA
jgi:hypothetical protein